MRDLNTWLDGLTRYQRELFFAVAFELCALTVMVVVAVGLVLVWPSLLPAVLIGGALMGVLIALAGQVVSYRVEDRRTARIKESRRG